MPHTFSARTAVLCGLLAPACAAPSTSDPSCDGRACDQLGEPLTCAVANRSGAGKGGVGRRVEELHDPIARLVLRAKQCPTTMEEVAAIDDCVASTGALVDEIGTAGGTSEGGRTLAATKCDDDDVFTSMLGVHDLGEFAESGELMAFDVKLAAFNFYALEHGDWSYFGSSTDLLAGKGPAGERRCAECHPGGSPIMKELRSPWVHWLGGAGSRLLMVTERQVRAATDRWTNTRVRHTLETATVRKALEPLFCTVEINLGALRSSETELPHNLFANPPFVGMGVNDFGDTFTTLAKDYDDLLVANNQRLEVAPGKPAKDEAGDVIRDASQPLIYPERSAVDTEYVRGLIENGFITQRFADDVRMVDFTRSVLSDRRCALLDLAPTTPASQATPDAITAAFVSALTAKATLQPGERELLTALQDTTADADHAAAQKSRLEAFFARCEALPDLTVQALRVASQLRELARRLPVIELRAQLPVDDLRIDANARLAESTCRLE